MNFAMRVSQCADGTPPKAVDYMTVTLSPPEPSDQGESCGQFVITVLRSDVNLKKYQYGATVPVTL